MAHRLCGLVMLAALASFEIPAPTWAEEPFFPGYGAGPVAPEVARQQGFRRDWGSFPPAAAGGGVAESGRPSAGVPRVPQSGGLPFPSRGQRDSPAAVPPATSWGTLVRLPDVEPALPFGASYVEAGPARAQPVDGMWPDDDRYRIDPFGESVAEPAHNPSGRTGAGSWLENDGQRIDLSGGAFAGAAPVFGWPVDSSWRRTGHHPANIHQARQRQLVEAPAIQGGTIYGRLLNRGRPLVNCHVVIVPLEKNGGSYVIDEARRPLKVITDDRGEYYFEDVPAGAYKLTWLPKGTNQWIRRIHWKPDAVVYGREAVAIKDIRMALRTIN